MSRNEQQQSNISVTSPFIVKMCVIIFLVTFVKGSLLVALLPVYMENILGLSVTTVGVAFALQYLGDNLFRSPFGLLMGKIGYRWTMTGALLLIIAAVTMIIYAEDAISLTFACLILGIGTSPLWPVTMTGISELAGATANGGSGAAMGAVEMASLAGMGIGPIAVNFLMDHGGYSYRSSFFVLVGCAAAVAVLALLLPSRIGSSAPHAVRTPGGEASSAPGGASRNPLRSLQRTLKGVRSSIKVSRLLFPALFLQAFAIGLMTPVVTLFAHAELHVTPNQYSLLLIAGGGITVAALIPAGRLVDRIGTSIFLSAGFLLAACSLAFFSTVRWLPLAFIAVALVGISYALILPAWNAFVAQQVPKEERGAVWGLFLTLQGFGMVAGPVISGRLWDEAGHSAPFLASACVMLLLFGLHLLIVRRTKLRLGRELQR
ncbi:MFS transporter ['Paenibacillus yunnanensis' Narsing Rao et al. 2020]|uniref:MFS transporter n=1 Tax=Paenibacillus tengchongensis TaxID=2608684 RepID=UPI00124C8D77|nr:MFS transporter [Paenibacillus tengchongensis]